MSAPSPRRSTLWMLLSSILIAAFAATAAAQPAPHCLDLNAYPAINPGVPEFTIDDVIFHEAVDVVTGGAGIGMDYLWPGFPPDALMDVFIPWSDPILPGGEFATIEFDPTVYGDGVDKVEFDAIHEYNYLEMSAIDIYGNIIGTPQLHTFGQDVPQHFVFQAPGPGQLIHRIEFKGAEIYLNNWCFVPANAVSGAGYVPLSGCLNIASLPLGFTDKVMNVQEVLFYRALLPTGASVAPIVRDRFAPGSDGVAEIDYDWSQTNAGAAQYGFIYFPATKFGHGPNKVELKVAHTNQADFVAYDGTGAVVSTATHPGPQDTWQWLTLSSADGIRRIDIVGAELGIQELCYEIFTRTGCVDAVHMPTGVNTHLLTIDKVEFEAAYDPTGLSLQMSTTDNLLAGTAPDGTSELFFGWSGPSGTLAKITFPAADFFLGPSTVEVVCAASSTLDLIARDASGLVLDTKSVSVAPLQLETLTLTGGNIRTVEMVGSQFWVQEVCWNGPYDLSTPAPAATSSARAHLFAPNPNPFNPRTHLRFAVDVAGPVELDVFDLRGRHVRTLLRGFREAGEHAVLWDGSDDQGMAVASGAYLVRLHAAGEVRMQRAALLK